MSISELKEMIKDQYEGEPWYGKSTIELLNSIDFDALPEKIETDIKAQILHMISWRYFVINKVKGHGDFNIKMNSEADWVPIEMLQKSSIEEIKRKLQISQIELIQSLDLKTDEWLMETVPNTKYNFAFLVNGIVQHDIYHIGQSFLLSKS